MEINQEKKEETEQQAEEVEAMPPIMNEELNKFYLEQEMPVFEYDELWLKTNDVKMTIVHNNICGEQVDAITNAANGALMHGGGVAGAISKGGGPVLNQESRAWVKKYG